jgi:cob(I)alamin adenosyltransferase
MPIYTKTGDKGKTSLFTNERVWKDSVRVEAYGTLDELNAYLGVVMSAIKKTQVKSLKKLLLTIQNDLFFIGSYLANPGEKRDLVVLKQHTDTFEDSIDEMTETMKPLTNFILPGGGTLGASLQYARTLARKSERRLVSLSREEGLEPEVLQYINRLSDLFFTMSRFANHTEKKKETIWKM